MLGQAQTGVSWKYKCFFVDILRVPLSPGGQLMYIHCCIHCGPNEERILDIVRGGTELGTQVKTGSRAGRTHTLNNSQVEYTGVLLCVIRE